MPWWAKKKVQPEGHLTESWEEKASYRKGHNSWRRMSWPQLHYPPVWLKTFYYLYCFFGLTGIKASGNFWGPFQTLIVYDPVRFIPSIHSPQQCLLSYLLFYYVGPPKKNLRAGFPMCCSLIIPWHLEYCLYVHACQVASVVSDSLWAMGCSLLGSSAHGILQVRILEWVAMPSPRVSSWPKDQISVSYVSCIGRQVLYQ